MKNTEDVKDITEIEELKVDIQRRREKMLLEYKVLTCIHTVGCVLLICGMVYVLVGGYNDV
ncbi:hypothetical protein COD17_08970 [Bacillus thuringiensis]|nr:hypothetical protein COD17_08970 [Bacillus thuringiensis]